jgi:ATP synthase protein I
MPSDPQRPKDNSGDEASWGRFAGIGLEIAVGVGLGALIGYWIDKRAGSSPWGLVVGAMLGLAGGMYLMIKAVLGMNRD